MPDSLIATIWLIGCGKQSFLYSVDKNAKIGDLILVPFKSTKKYGVIFDIKSRESMPNIDFKVREIDNIIYHNIIKHNFFEFIKTMAAYNLNRISDILEGTIPTNLLQKPKREIKKEEDTFEHTSQTMTLNEKQNEVFQAIIKNQNFNVSLIDGVTGSGKTFVFIALINHILSSNHDAQILILVPEISITKSLIANVQKYITQKVNIWHSSVTNKTKRDLFKNIINGNAKVVISARSGLLLPYKNLKLIIVDEEHDGSYKQNNSPIYNARDMAILRAKYEDIPVILSSATPSIETFYNVAKGKYKRYVLSSMFFDVKRPNIEILNISRDEVINIKTSKYYIATSTRKAIVDTIKSGKQVMIFINRRGFSKALQCCDCKAVINCVSCASSMSYHSKKHILKCHYCGSTNKHPDQCSQCGGHKFAPYSGAGVEQITEEVKAISSDIKPIIFSSDEADTVSKLDNIISEIKTNNANLIIGTQIISKGHHFPDLALLVVLDIDYISSIDSDFRAFEKAFQMLTQLAGRPGREQEGARVIIQTYNPDNKVLQAIKNNDRNSFYEIELQNRFRAKLPPYSKLVAIVVSCEDNDDVVNFVNDLKGKLDGLIAKHTTNKCILLGPAESIVPYLNRQHRYRFLIKLEKTDNGFTRKLQSLIDVIVIPNNINIKVDIDPYEFM